MKILYFFFSFCNRNPPKEDYEVIITVTSDSTSAPRSAFSIAACPSSKVSNGEECTTSNFAVAVVDPCACILTSVTMTNDEGILDQGIYVNVYGEGSPPLSNGAFVNSFTLSAKIPGN